MFNSLKYGSFAVGVAIAATTIASPVQAATVTQVEVTPIQTTLSLNEIYNYGGFETGANYFPGYRGVFPINPVGTTLALIQASDGLGLLAVSKSSQSPIGGLVAYTVGLPGWSNVSVVQLDDPPQIDNDPFSLSPVTGGFQVTRFIGYGNAFTDGELLKLEGQGRVNFTITNLFHGIDSLAILLGDGQTFFTLDVEDVLNGNSVELIVREVPESSTLGSLGLLGMGLLMGSFAFRRGDR